MRQSLYRIGFKKGRTETAKRTIYVSSTSTSYGKLTGREIETTVSVPKEEEYQKEVSSELVIQKMTISNFDAAHKQVAEIKEKVNALEGLVDVYGLHDYERIRVPASFKEDEDSDFVEYELDTLVEEKDDIFILIHTGMNKYTATIVAVNSLKLVPHKKYKKYGFNEITFDSQSYYLNMAGEVYKSLSESIKDEIVACLNEYLDTDMEEINYHIF